MSDEWDWSRIALLRAGLVEAIRADDELYVAMCDAVEEVGEIEAARLKERPKREGQPVS